MYCLCRKDETDKEVNELKKNCEVYGKRLHDHVQSQLNNVQKKRLNFEPEEINFDGFSLGKIEIKCQETVTLVEGELFEEKNESQPEVPIRPITRRNASATRKHRYLNSIGIKLSSKDRLRNIIESKKLQSFRLIGREGLDDGEFRHPLGIQIVTQIYVIVWLQ